MFSTSLERRLYTTLLNLKCSSRTCYLWSVRERKVKVKVNVDLYIAHCRERTSKALRYGTRSQGISQFYLHSVPAFIFYRNEPYLPLPSQPKLVLIYRPRRDGRLSWLRKKLQNLCHLNCGF